MVRSNVSKKCFRLCFKITKTKLGEFQRNTLYVVGTALDILYLSTKKIAGVKYPSDLDQRLVGCLLPWKAITRPLIGSWIEAGA